MRLVYLLFGLALLIVVTTSACANPTADRDNQTALLAGAATSAVDHPYGPGLRGPAGSSEPGAPYAAARPARARAVLEQDRGGRQRPRPHAAKAWREPRLGRAIRAVPARAGRWRLSTSQCSTRLTRLPAGYRATPESLPFASASVDAAVAQAAHDTLVAMFPAQTATMNQLLAEDLNQIVIPEQEHCQARGLAVGHQAAAAILALRTNDGSQIPDPTVNVNFFCGNQPGKWRQDPISLSPTGARRLLGRGQAVCDAILRPIPRSPAARHDQRRVHRRVRRRPTARWGRRRDPDGTHRGANADRHLLGL